MLTILATAPKASGSSGFIGSWGDNPVTLSDESPANVSVATTSKLIDASESKAQPEVPFSNPLLVTSFAPRVNESISLTELFM